ncbi:hypothetical protein [Haladaptatus sp. NG-WS-4]
MLDAMWPDRENTGEVDVKAREVVLVKPQDAVLLGEVFLSDCLNILVLVTMLNLNADSPTLGKLGDRELNEDIRSTVSERLL